MRRLTAISSCIAFLLCGSTSVFAADHHVDVAKHASIIKSDSDVDAMLRGASKILKDDDDGTPGIVDQPCDVTFHRSGSVSNFVTSAPSKITSLASWNQVAAEPAFVKIVSAITYCGKVANFDGCTAQPGRDIVVIDGLQFPGEVFAHEFGHATGLSHRSGPKLLMSDLPLSSANRSVDGAECDSFRNGPPSQVESFKLSSMSATVGDHDLELLTGEKFLESDVVDRLPYRQLSRLNDEIIPKLRILLEDESKSRQWPNALTLLGILGSQEDIRYIVEFLGRGHESVNPDHAFRASLSGMFALSYLAYRHQDADAIKALLDKTQAESWRGLWIGDGMKALQETAFSALALSGAREVDTVLNYVAQQTATSPDENVTAMVTDLRGIASDVRRLGLADYYGKDE